MLTYPEIDPVIFSIGFLKIRWYGLMYVIGFLLAWWLAKRRCQRPDSPVTPEQVDDLVFYVMLGVIVGGRLGYILFYGWANMAEDPLYIVKIWQGGMSFHGGLAGVLIAMWLYGRKLGKPFFEMTDFVSIGGNDLKQFFFAADREKDLLPIGALVVIVLGGIYSGFFTPTEAGAAGAAAALLVAVLKGSLTWRRFWRVLVDTGLVSVSILLLIIAASMYSRMLTLSTIPQQATMMFAEAGLSLMGFMLIYLVLVIIMGMILDSTSIMIPRLGTGTCPTWDPCCLLTVSQRKRPRRAF